jgi:hypothetical protein
MEHQSTSEGMRQRITRGAYSSSNKKKISIGGYDVVAEYGNATKQSAGWYEREHINSELKFDFESNIGQKEYNEEYFTRSDSFVPIDEHAKLSKLVEEDSICIESINDVSTQSMESVPSSVRNLRKDNDSWK